MRLYRNRGLVPSTFAASCVGCRRCVVFLLLNFPESLTRFKRKQKGHSRHEQQGASTKAKAMPPVRARRAATRAAQGRPAAPSSRRASGCSHAARRQPAGRARAGGRPGGPYGAQARPGSSRQPGGLARAVALVVPMQVSGRRAHRRRPRPFSRVRTRSARMWRLRASDAARGCSSASA